MKPLIYYPLIFATALISNYFNLVFVAQRLYARYLGPSPPRNGSNFDFIVVGSGSAGSVVAARLAQAGQKVLLIEAGGPSNFFQGIPAFAPLFMTSAYDWGHEIQPGLRSAGAFKVNGVKYPRGKSLGGTSMLNWMIHARGFPEDFDEWEDLGNPGWAFERVLPFFKKSEEFRSAEANENRGLDGPLTVEEHEKHSPLEETFLDAVWEFGFGMQVFLTGNPVITIHLRKARNS